MSERAVLNALQGTLQHRQDVLFLLDALYHGREQEVWLNEIANVFKTLSLYFLLQCLDVGIFLHCPQLLECHLVISQRFVGMLLYLLRQILVEDEAQGEIHEVACRHVATQLVGDFPKLVTEFLL